MSRHLRNSWRVICVLLLVAAATAAQGPAAPPEAFAAVSIKPFHFVRGMVLPRNLIETDPAGLHWVQRNLRDVIGRAYGIEDYQLTGGDPWTRSYFFNLDATTSAPATNEQLMTMLRAVLVDRFGLKLAQGTKSTQALALVVDQGGFKARGLAPGEQARHVIEMTSNTTQQPFETIQDLTAYLNRVGPYALKGRIVLDQTGLTGRYDMSITLPVTISGEIPHRRFSPGYEELPSALKKLGLDLQPVSVPVTFYAIESAHEPTAN